MLVNFWSSSDLRKNFDLSFSYRYSPEYEKGMRERAVINFPLYPLHISEVSNLFSGRWPVLLEKISVKLVRIAFKPFIFFAQVLSLWRLFKKIEPQILHINNGGYPAALSARSAAVAARLAGVPTVIMVVNNFTVGYTRPNRWLEYLLDRWVVASVHMFVTGSRSAAVRLRSVLRLPESQCISIHNGIKLRPVTETVEESRKRFGLANFSGLVMGVVAILRPNKGHIVLLQAIDYLVRDQPVIRNQLRILIEGDGPCRDYLVEFVKKNSLEDICVFVGCEPNIMNFVSSLDVLILSSIGQEDFPNVIIEAMGLGKAVIASRLAGIPEQLVENETGFLVSPCNVKELAEAVHKFVLDRTLISTMGNAGARRFVENFTAEKSVANYLNLYRFLMGVK